MKLIIKKKKFTHELDGVGCLGVGNQAFSKKKKKRICMLLKNRLTNKSHVVFTSSIFYNTIDMQHIRDKTFVCQVIHKNHME
jgi:hypothetical protein